MPQKRQQLSIWADEPNGRPIFDRLHLTREALLSKAAYYSSRALAYQRRRTLESFHTLGSTIIANGGASRPDDRTPWTFIREGELVRPDGLVVEARVAEMSGALIGNDVCPEIREGHEVSVTGYDKSTGVALPGMVYRTNSWVYRDRSTLNGTVLAAPIFEHTVSKSALTEQQPLDIVPLDALLSRLTWGETQTVGRSDAYSQGPQYIK